MDEQGAKRITPRQFHEAVDVGDWRVVQSAACAHFRTGSFAAGVALVDAIGRLAGGINRSPDAIGAAAINYFFLREVDILDVLSIGIECS
jgi:hypothetical protein